MLDYISDQFNHQSIGEHVMLPKCRFVYVPFDDGELYFKLPDSGLIHHLIAPTDVECLHKLGLIFR